MCHINKEENIAHSPHQLDAFGSILRDASYMLSSSRTQLPSSRYWATCSADQKWTNSKTIKSNSRIVRCNMFWVTVHSPVHYKLSDSQPLCRSTAVCAEIISCAPAIDPVLLHRSKNCFPKKKNSTFVHLYRCQWDTLTTRTTTFSSHKKVHNYIISTFCYILFGDVPWDFFSWCTTKVGKHWCYSWHWLKFEWK